jgi:membrane protein YqaA with SNARE-associated domain
VRRGTAKLYSWATNKATSTKAPFWLGLLFFLELFLFIPLDAVLMFFCLQDRKKIFLYIAIATIASTVSGLMGYLFGHFLWDLTGHWVVPNVIGTAAFERVTTHFHAYEEGAVFFGSFLPFPIKILSVVGGVFNLGVVPFVTFMALARLLRFSLIGMTVAFWGDQVKAFVDRHFHRLFLLIGAKIAAAFVFFWMLAT